MLCMTFNNSLILTASIVVMTQTWNLRVFLFHADTDSLVSVMTMSVCVGRSGGRRLGPPAPGSRSQPREVRAPVASRAGHNNIMWPGPSHSATPASVIRQSGGCDQYSSNNSEVIRKMQICNQGVFCLTLWCWLSFKWWPPTTLSIPDLWDEIPLRGPQLTLRSPVCCGVESCVYLPYQVLGLTNLTRRADSYQSLDWKLAVTCQ